MLTTNKIYTCGSTESATYVILKYTYVFIIISITIMI